MHSRIITTVSSALLLSACSSAPSEPSGSGPGAAEGVPRPSPSVASTSTEVRAGFVHGLDRSRFRVGSNASELDEFGAHKVVGAEGVFSVRPTGLVIGLSNADAPTRAKPPLPGGSAAHDALVRSYFIDSGLPADQILDVSPYTVMSKVGRNGPDFFAQATSKLEYQFSVISRQIDGIRVDDSYAWARLDADGAAVLESVYWPEIPAQIVRDAVAFQTRLADDAGKRVFLAKVPREGSLVIHHTPGEWVGAFAATASYDVGEEHGKVTHFDMEGRRLELPHEAENAWGEIPRPTRARAVP
jgi:hypothetical protein